ncbi:NAD(P)/FAD-dependent oxidoreductase [Blautia sp.]
MEKVIIIGAGPAGISAALYAARANMDPLVINNGIGALEKAEKIENYYGMEHPVSGKELFETGIAQAKALGVRILEAQVLGIGGFDTFQVKTTAGDFDTISVILATGSKRKAPAIPGIKEFEGNGVSYCAVCDAFFYRGKDVAVLGNSDFALHEAEELAPMAGSVTIYTDGKEPEFSKEVSFPVNTMKIQSVEGDMAVSGLRLVKGEAGENSAAASVNPSELNIQESQKAGGEQEIFAPADGVFVALGTAGSAEMARQMGAALTEKGNIKVNEKMESTIPGLFAAGDCTGGLLQVAKAVYDGAQAGLSANQYVRNKKKG